MGRKRRISEDAKPTTISLTPLQQLAFQELAIKRMRAGAHKPLLNEVMVEGLAEVLKKEGWSESELAKVFPKRERIQAKLHIFPKRSRKNRTNQIRIGITT